MWKRYAYGGEVHIRDHMHEKIHMDEYTPGRIHTAETYIQKGIHMNKPIYRGIYIWSGETYTQGSIYMEKYTQGGDIRIKQTV